MIYIIGSGAAGVSAAKALLARGVAVTMLDVGVQLKDDKKNSLEGYHKIQQPIYETDNIKLSYGSDYIYQGVNKFLNFRCSKQVLCMPSFAQGGLSNVWGAFAMPYTETELKNWPFSSNDLSTYYEKIFEYVPLAVGLYDRSDRYPLYTDSFISYQQSEQAKKILQTMKKNVSDLHSNGFEFGSARLAVNFSINEKSQCIYCGLCQHGCPDKLIYSACDTLNELIKNKNFNYIKNIVVSHYIENENGVTIHADDFSNNQKITFFASQIFLAAGVISSTKILLASLKLYNTPVQLKDSQHFMIPAITYRSVKNVKTEKLHTMTQLFVRLSNQKFLTNSAHLQLYTYMDHYEAEFKRLLKSAYPFLKWILTPILNRMVVLQGFLDSSDSVGCEMTLKEDNKTIFLQGGKDEGEKKIKWIQKALLRNRKQLGFISVPFLSKISKILLSHHYGGTFPMSKNVSQMTTDLLGRPFQSRRIHVIDATVFPTIPAGSITPSIMANAYRIASECDIYE